MYNKIIKNLTYYNLRNTIKLIGPAISAMLLYFYIINIKSCKIKTNEERNKQTNE